MVWTSDADRRGRVRIVLVAALLVGLLPAFFVAFNVVYSDVARGWERVWSLAYVLGAYLLFGAVFGIPRHAQVIAIGAALALPALLLLAWYATQEPQDLLLHLGVALLALLGATLGVALMRAIRSRRAA